MCISDWRIGRQIKAIATAWNLTGSVNLVFPASRQRVGILISWPAGVIVLAHVLLITFTNGTVISLTTYNGTLLINMETYGELPTYGFTISSTLSTQPGTITEFFLPEEVLQAGLEEFRREYKFK